MSDFFRGLRLNHLSRGDAHLFKKWYAEHGPRFYGYQFDVRVGQGVKLPADAPSWLTRTADALSRKRIDVIMEDLRNIYIMELRVRAKAGVIGDLIGYRSLYTVTEQPRKNVVVMLVTDEVEPDLLISLQELGIIFFIV